MNAENKCIRKYQAKAMLVTQMWKMELQETVPEIYF